MSNDRSLNMQLSGRFIDLLGVEMYGGSVPAIAELIANAWDADSDKVEISYPEDIQNSNAKIVVKDYGTGMTFEELQEYYLVIGHERRKRGEKTAKGRHVMGRKGIGKFAGFGIAENMVVKSVCNNHLVEFALNYSEIKAIQDISEFKIPLLRDEPTKEPSGVTITLKDLKLKRNISVEIFRKSIAARFAFSNEEMQVFVNDEEISKSEAPYEFREPDEIDKWHVEEVERFGKIWYWYAFTKEPISDSENKGFSIYAHGRIAEMGCQFKITGGINGQVGLEYLTGQILADPLDEEKDLISTDRRSINWDMGKAAILEKWGQELVKYACADWKKRREKQKEKLIRDVSQINLRISKLQPQEKEDVKEALHKISRIETLDNPQFELIANSIIDGVQRESVKKIIRRINEVDENSVEVLVEALHEWDVISSIMTSEIVQGRIDVINQFRELIILRTPEKTKEGVLDMQTFAKEYPWILGQEYDNLKPEDLYHERGVGSFIKEAFINIGQKYQDSAIANKRFDLLAYTGDGKIKVVEFMRPGLPADLDHVDRLIAYVSEIRAQIEAGATGKDAEVFHVTGMLVADELAKDTMVKDRLEHYNNRIEACTWKTLLSRVQGRYGEFLQILETKTQSKGKDRESEAV